MEIYAENQMKHVLPFVDDSIKWFLLGGTADANEAQTLHKKFPKIQIVGFEPNPEMFKLQIASGFPGTLLPLGLWNENTEKLLCRGDTSPAGNRSASLVRHTNVKYREHVRCLCLDFLSRLMGPFNQSFLWLDIEGAELYALQGAKELLEDPDGIQLINLEAISELEAGTRDYLKQFGFEEVHRWNEQQQPELKWCDIVYKRAK